MSQDIATLGIKVDSSDTVKATTALQALTGAAKPAANAADALAHSHEGLSAQAQAAFHSTRSLVEAIASGQPVTQALTQQVSHLSYAATGPGGLSGAFSQAAKAVFGLVSPATLVIGGLAAVAAGGLFAAHSIAQTEKAFDDTSHAAGTTISQLHDLAAAASFKGIDSSEFLKTMDKFASDVFQAQHNMGGLAEVFRANNVSAKSFNDYLEKAADLIKSASSDQQRLQLLQQMGLPATMEWVRFLSQGKDGIRAAIDEATKFGNVADEAMVRKAREFDEAWAKAISNFSNGFKSGFISFIGYLGELDSKAASLLQKLGADVGNNRLRNAMTGGVFATDQLTQSKANDFYGAVGTAAPFNAAAGAGGTRDKNVILADIARQQPLLGLLGQAQPVKKSAEKEKDDDRNPVRLPAAA